MIVVSHIADVLGGQQILGRRLGSLAALNDAVAEGLPKAALRQTASRIFTGKLEQRQLMNRIVPEATFKRRRDRLRLGRKRTDRANRESGCECRACLGRPRGCTTISDGPPSGAS
jgi:uncharacterized protein (DUF2384 family)